MEPMEAETLLRKLDRRTQEIEQILPTLPTRTELHEAIDAAVRPLATHEELGAAVVKLATKDELAATVATLATKDELAAAVAKLATKEELAAAVAKLATKEELAAAVATLATKEQLAGLRRDMRQEGERTRRHFDVVAESIHDTIRVVAENYAGVLEKVRRERKDVGDILTSHDKRITRLEVADSRRRKQR